MEGSELHVGSGWVDSFTISGSGLAVYPQAKLATTWGNSSSISYLSTLLTQREVTVTENIEVKADFVIKGTGVISGFLLDPITKLPLLISGKMHVELLTSDDRWVKSTNQGEVSNGYFEVKNLLSGRYVIIDAFDGYVFALSDSSTVTVYPDSNIGGIEVFLKPGASLIGSFADAENGNPISGVGVNASSQLKDTVYPESSFTYSTETETNGEFHLTVPNDADTY